MPQAKISSSSPDVNTNVGKVDQAFAIEVESADGAIGIKEGTAFITKSTAAALTLVAPTAGLPSAGGDDGKVLCIVGTTAHAHTVTTPSNKINGNKLTATFAAVGDAIVLCAYNGVWYAAENSTTLS